ncbi:MAG: hypothetical protein M1817_001520 [Caeruleum heppii]|nr:MAG: hypothetical protein M1817_001520 [Caeruleum heppii]
MIRQDSSRIDAKRRATLDHKRKQFATPNYKTSEYPHRLNFYTVPPTAEITLEQFEQWAIDRLRILTEIESCSFRQRSPAETAGHIKPLLDKYLPLSSNSSHSSNLKIERQKDHYSHFILRLAFSGTEDLRRRFARVETALFKLRFQHDDARERQSFVEGLSLEWEMVGDDEKRRLGPELIACTPGVRRVDEESWFKLDWERVPELVEGRRVLLRHGKAYVPVREQMSMVLSEFTTKLDHNLELTSRALPRLDEDDRLTPILNHLSKNFATPTSFTSSTSTPLPGASITAASIDSLAQHFPLCMSNLHVHLRRNAHLKHYGRLQYTLFLKGMGLTLEDCLLFWRAGFKNITDDVFNKEYRYNVRHTYGDVGGDANRRGRGYSPFSCQKILTEHPPGPGETHGCPYRHAQPAQLDSLLQMKGIQDRDVLRGVREDVEKKRFHIGCNRVFDFEHKRELKRVKDDPVLAATFAAGGGGDGATDTIVHPNTYFRRAYLLKNLDKMGQVSGGGGGAGEGGNGEGGGENMES